MALEAGATHVDTSVLGIGERNGIPSLGGFLYNLTKLKALEDLVATAVEVNSPFNNQVTGFCAFTHKAGIDAKEILANPATYEAIDPKDSGMQRYVHFASRLTGWNAIKSRCDQFGVDMTDTDIKERTAEIKAIRKLAVEDIDTIIGSFYNDLGSAKEEDPICTTREEKKMLARKEMEFHREAEELQRGRQDLCWV